MIDGCSFTGNKAPHGAAMYVGGAANISNSYIQRNVAAQSSGAIYAISSLTVYNTVIQNNTASTGTFPMLQDVGLWYAAIWTDGYYSAFQ